MTGSSAAPFDLEFVAVNHSIPDALAVAIRTPAGQLVVHTGDFKMDQLPLDGRITDLRAFSSAGRRGCRPVAGRLHQRRGPWLRRARDATSSRLSRRSSHRAKRRIIVASFASHIHRVQQILDIAAAHGRKVAFVGRSMVRNMNVARDLGYLTIPADLVVDLQAARRPARRRGRPGLHRLTGRADGGAVADGQPRPLHHASATDDTVILASSLIPGNENAVYRVINGLMRWGANVVHKGNAMVHVSGHAAAGELLYVYNIVGPRNVMPVHGEIRHLHANAELAVATGVPRERRGHRRGRRRRRPR